MLKYSLIKKFHNFNMVSSKFFPNNNIEMQKYENKISGSKYIHFKNNDDNKSFAVLIKTLLDDDTGKPHVLEHLSLCGSKKYPIRDPFFNMLKRSINTYMNAWTGTEFTMFPFSTINNKDFNNLLKIYLDAVFQPNLDYYNFRQEGWRHTLDKNNKLGYSGVVYNEMKGSNDNRDSLVINFITKIVFEGSELGLNSGGISNKILDLKYDDLKSYHSKYYNANNAVFVSYGNLDLDPTMNYIEDNYIANSSKENLKMNHNLKPKFSSLTQPKTETIKLKPLLKDDKKHSFIKVFVVNNNIQIEKDDNENIAFSILNYYLFRSPNSPLKKNIIDEGLAGNLFNYGGYMNYLPENLFIIGFDYVEEKNIELVNKKIIEILENLELDDQELSSIYHQFEISNKIKTANEGINLFQSTIPFLNYGNENYLDSIFDIGAKLNKLKENKGYYKELINKYLLENNKIVDINIVPNASYNDNVRKEESDRLDKEFSKMTEEDLTKIKEENSKIKELQDKKEDENILPKIDIKDIEKTLKHSRIDKTKINNVEVWGNEENMEDLIKITINFDIRCIEESFFNHLFLLKKFYNKTGTKKTNQEDFIKKFKNKATTLSFNNTCFDNISVEKNMEHNLIITFSFLKDNMNDALTNLSEILWEPDFNDKENYSNLIKLTSNENSDNIINNPFGYLFNYASKKYSISNQKVNSFDLNRFLINYGNNYEKSSYKGEYLEDLAVNFELIQNKFLKKNNMKIMYHCSNIDKNKNYIETNIDNFLNKLSSKVSFNEEKNLYSKFELDNISNFRYLNLPQEINYVCQTFKTPNLKSKDHAILRLLGSIMSRTYLHNLIREKGGAYGSGIRFSDNTMNLFSYRDPNTFKTLENFKFSIDKMIKGEFSMEDIEGGKLFLLSSLDKPVPPQSKNIGEFIYNISTQDREDYRLNIINSSKEELIQVANKYLNNCENSVLIFGSNKNDLSKFEEYEKINL